jgi:hypothetical protein
MTGCEVLSAPSLIRGRNRSPGQMSCGFAFLPAMPHARTGVRGEAMVAGEGMGLRLWRLAQIENPFSFLLRKKPL